MCVEQVRERAAREQGRQERECLVAVEEPRPCIHAPGFCPTRPAIAARRERDLGRSDVGGVEERRHLLARVKAYQVRDVTMAVRRIVPWIFGAFPFAKLAPASHPQAGIELAQRGL